MESITFQKALLDWYYANQRDLPWRQNHDPYRIWLSEIMLQQTQVITVIDYFQRFTAAYPDVFRLAAAKEDDIFKLWEGLGYYSRAKNLLRCARVLVAEHQGIFPKDEKTLLSLPGIGPYTAGAILSIAYNLKVPAVDGNVLRVYARLYSLFDDIADPKVRPQFEKLVREDLPEDRRHFNQALMELGALICTPKSPKCDSCPVSAHCKAFETNCIPQLPVKLKKLKRSEHLVAVAYVTFHEEVLLIKRPPEGLLANLWGFPAIELDLGADSEKELTALKDWLSEHMDLAFTLVKETPASRAKHVFTHKTWHMDLWHLEADKKVVTDLPEMAWVKRSGISQYPLPTAFVKLLEAQ